VANRPRGNLTGVSLFKLHQLVRANSVIAVLLNPENPSANLHLKDLEKAAQKLGHEIRVARASKANDFGAMFADDLVQHRIASIVVDDDAFFSGQAVRLAELAARHSIAAIYSNRDAVADGGLMSYGVNIADAFRQCGVYVGRILRGEKPGDLPVFQPTKFEFVINLKTAKALGLTIPETLLATADQVIE
jgi:putative tryptophan/tyrosine transport system substrate-binding protein